MLFTTWTTDHKCSITKLQVAISLQDRKQRFHSEEEYQESLAQTNASFLAHIKEHRSPCYNPPLHQSPISDSLVPCLYVSNNSTSTATKPSPPKASSSSALACPPS